MDSITNLEQAKEGRQQEMDWIDSFMAYTTNLPTPAIYRLWSAITAVSGALDRRVWADIGLGPIWPNLYTLLVGPPGTGKSQAIAPVKKFWLESKVLNLAPDSVTKPALIDCLHKNVRFFLNDQVPNGMLELHSILVALPELGVLLSKHDLEFLSVLNHIFDSPPNYREERRSMEGRNPDISNPQITILAGTQPDFLASMMPEEAWGMGFCSRLLLIYAPEPPKLVLFSTTNRPNPKLESKLQESICRMSELYGELEWSPDARLAVVLWYEHGMAPVPDYPKLLHYNTRRLLQLVKLIIVSTVSRSTALKITIEDVERAKDWMIQAERLMPDIFRAMLSRSDSEILSELHMHVWKIWSSTIPEKRAPVKEEEIYHYLKDKLPSERIDKIVDIAQKAGFLQHSAGGGWIPRPIIAN